MKIMIQSCRSLISLFGRGEFLGSVYIKHFVPSLSANSRLIVGIRLETLRCERAGKI